MHRSKRTLARVALLCLLVIGFSWPTQYAEAQNARCPCFNEMFIVGACKRFVDLEWNTFRNPSDLYAQFSCGLNNDGWRFVTSDLGTEKSFCQVFTVADRGAIREIELSEPELGDCFRGLTDACSTLDPVDADEQQPLCGS